MLIFDSSIPANFVIIVLSRKKLASSRNRTCIIRPLSIALHIPLRDNARKIILFMCICVCVRVYTYILCTINSRFANIGTWTLFVYPTSREREKMSKRKTDRQTETEFDRHLDLLSMDMIVSAKHHSSDHGWSITRRHLGWFRGSII